MLSGLLNHSTNAPPMKVAQNTIDREWEDIQAALKDVAAFRPLYDKYYEQIFRFVYRRTSDEALSADLCSQVFLKAMQKIHTYTFKGVPFSAWLYRIASNEVTQYYRNSQKNRIVSIREANLEEMTDEIDDFDYEKQRNTLLKALNTLPQDDMQFIELRFFEQRSFKEVGQILGITENNAKTRTYRVLAKIKRSVLTC